MPTRQTAAPRRAVSPPEEDVLVEGPKARAETRVERRRNAVVEEVKEIARDRLLADGEGGLSLRAIARDMGVVPSTLYRYFPSHGHLLDALADDAARSMLDHVRACDEAPAADAHNERWLASMRGFRSWVLAHQPGYSLNFGPLAAERTDERPPDSVVDSLIHVLTPNLEEAHSAGLVDLRGLTQHAIGDRSDVEPASNLAYAAALSAWSALHGMVALEVASRLPTACIEPDELFESQLAITLVAMGMRLP